MKVSKIKRKKNLQKVMVLFNPLPHWAGVRAASELHMAALQGTASKVLSKYMLSQDAPVDFRWDFLPKS